MDKPIKAVAAERLSAEDRASAAFELMSPGRVNLIGDHIDYSGGLVMPMALDRGTRAVVFPRRDRLINGFSASFPSQAVVSAHLDDTGFDPDHGWFSYVLGVVHTAVAQGLDVPAGFDIYLLGNIPRGGGLSSSASVEMAAATALEELFGFGLSPTQWAVLAKEAENQYVGVSCGIMDQLSIARGREGHAIEMNCDTLDCDYVPMPMDRCSILIASTNHPRKLADSAYNDRRSAVDTARSILAAHRGSPVRHLVEVSLDEIEGARKELDDAGVTPFARHTVTEQARVIEAAEALRRGDLTGLGRLMGESHMSLRDDFQVTGEHLDALAEAAWASPGVIGARMTGAGFGGCTVNLVERGAEDAAAEEIASRYREATGILPDLYRVSPADGAHVVR